MPDQADPALIGQLLPILSDPNTIDHLMGRDWDHEDCTAAAAYLHARLTAEAAPDAALEEMRQLRGRLDTATAELTAAAAARTASALAIGRLSRQLMKIYDLLVSAQCSLSAGETDAASAQIALAMGETS